jgi:thiamine-phosphate pyrophosphorylase
LNRANEPLLLYYITDRTALGSTEAARRAALFQKISEAARAGIDLVQLREKDLPANELEKIAKEAARLVRELSQGRTKLLINSRSDVALASGADGVHLRSNDVSPEDLLAIWKRARSAEAPLIGLSCHTEEEAANAVGKADFAVFSPVFKNKDSSHISDGLSHLRSVCRSKIPVLALGGVTSENALRCLDSGAAGIAGIRLFQENDLSRLVALLRAACERP